MTADSAAGVLVTFAEGVRDDVRELAVGGADHDFHYSASDLQAFLEHILGDLFQGRDFSFVMQ